MIPRISLRLLRLARRNLPPLNFLTIHYSYFVGTCILSSLIFWGSSTPSRSITYTDSLFLIVSAMTEAGLNTVNLSELNTFQQWLLWFHILIGSAIFVSAFVVQIRKRAFESRFKAIIKAQKEESRERRRSLSLSKERPSHGQQLKNAPNSRCADGPYDESPFESRHSQPRDPATEEKATAVTDAMYAGHGAQSTSVAGKSGESFYVRNSEAPAVVVEKVSDSMADRITFSDAPREQNPLRQRRNSNQALAENSATSNDLREGVTSLHSHDFIKSEVVGRNSQFHGLSREERESLGGVEYKAIKLLSYIVPLYFVSWQIFTSIGLGAYMAHNKAELIRQNGLNPW